MICDNCETEIVTQMIELDHLDLGFLYFCSESCKDAFLGFGSRKDRMPILCHSCKFLTGQRCDLYGRSMFHDTRFCDGYERKYVEG